MRGRDKRESCGCLCPSVNGEAGMRYTQLYCKGQRPVTGGGAHRDNASTHTFTSVYSQYTHLVHINLHKHKQGQACNTKKLYT